MCSAADEAARLGVFRLAWPVPARCRAQGELAYPTLVNRTIAKPDGSAQHNR